MNKIKIVGALVFIISLILALISMDISKKNRVNIATLSSFSKQKESIQEVSKSIFYSYRNGDRGSKIVEEFILNSRESDFNRLYIKNLWQEFYSDVKRFKTQQKIATGYNSIITAKLVNRIYHKNVLLINEFNRIIELKKAKTQSDIEIYKRLQNLLFFILIAMLFYLFTQLHLIVAFIHQFSKTSKDIIKNSTIKGVESIDIKTTSSELKEATDNYNYMVENINISIVKSSQSMNQSIKSLEEVAQNIENFMELLSIMNPKESDEFFKKEDVVIDSLDTLMSLRKRLKDLKIDLDKLS